MKKTIFIILLLAVMVFAGICISADDNIIYFESTSLQHGYIPVSEPISTFSLTRNAVPEIDELTFTVIENRIVSAWENLDEEIDLTDIDITYDQFYTYVVPEYFNILDRYPQIFYHDASAGCSENYMILYPRYYYEIEDIPQYIEAFNDAVSDIVSVIDPKNMSDIDIALALHDYLVLNAEYDVDTYVNSDTGNRESFTAYGILVNKKGVCTSYTLAYHQLLNQFDIENHPVTSSEISHAWSMIKIGEDYFHVDVTHDDPVTDRLGVSKYTYFLCSDSELLADGNHGSVWEGEKTADADTYIDAFWKKTRSTMAYYDDVYYLAVTEDQKNYKICSATTDSFNETVQLRALDNVLWKFNNNDNQYYKGGQMYVNVFVVDGFIYYNDCYNVYRYCPGFDSDEIAFTYGNLYGFIRPIPQKSINNLCFLHGVYDVVDSSNVLTISDTMTADLEGHAYASQVISPTDTEIGYTEHVCSTCSHTYRDLYTNPLKYLLGDIDGNGEIQPGDHVILSRHVAGWLDFSSLDYHFNCDLDNDEVIGPTDIIILSRHLSQWSGYEIFPAA